MNFRDARDLAIEVGAAVDGIRRRPPAAKQRRRPRKAGSLSRRAWQARPAAERRRATKPRVCSRWPRASRSLADRGTAPRGR
jgi:hypothetical protein